MSCESGCALFSAVLFLMLFSCSNTQMDSSSRIVRLSLSVSAGVSVCHSAHMARKANLPMHSKISLGILDGNFRSHPSCCEASEFLTVLISSISVLLPTHSGADVIGNSTATCWRNNIFACLRL